MKPAHECSVFPPAGAVLLACALLLGFPPWSVAAVTARHTSPRLPHISAANAREAHPEPTPTPVRRGHEAMTSGSLPRGPIERSAIAADLPGRFERAPSQVARFGEPTCAHRWPLRASPRAARAPPRASHAC